MATPPGVDPTAAAANPQKYQEWLQAKQAFESSGALSPQYAQGAPGVNTPGTPSTQPGWSYGANLDQSGIQKSVTPGQTDTSKIGWDGTPVKSIQQGDPLFQKSIDAYMKQAESRLNPRMEQEQKTLEAQLQNMGLTRGSAAWNSEMDRQMRARNDAYTSAQNQAIMAGGADAARMQGMDLAAGEFANKAAQQDFGNRLQSQEQQNKAYEQLFQ
jgi:hypothetical protein